MDTQTKASIASKPELTSAQKAQLSTRIAAISDKLPKQYAEMMVVYNPALADDLERIKNVKGLRTWDEEITVGLEHVAAIYSEALQKLESIGRLAREGVAL